MLDKHLSKTGKLTIEKGQILVEGFEADDAMCREVAALALIWAIGELQGELQAIVQVPGGTDRCVVD